MQVSLAVISLIGSVLSWIERANILAGWWITNYFRVK